MNKPKRSTVLDVSGLASAIIFPATAAVVEFPHVQSKVSGAGAFIDALHLSAAAFAIIAIISVLAFWRFFREKFHLGKSGLFPTLAITFAVYGVYQFIYAFLIIMVWASVGAVIAQILYIAADKEREKEQDGKV